MNRCWLQTLLARDILCQHCNGDINIDQVSLPLTYPLYWQQATCRSNSFFKFSASGLGTGCTLIVSFVV
jgi:hypothetical protein